MLAAFLSIRDDCLAQLKECVCASICHNCERCDENRAATCKKKLRTNGVFTLYNTNVNHNTLGVIIYSGSNGLQKNEDSFLDIEDFEGL